MWILSEDLKSLFNTNNIVDIYITPSGDAIKVALSGHTDLTLGEYGCREETGFVFGQILAALTDGCKLHRMPPKEQKRDNVLLTVRRLLEEAAADERV